MSSPSLAIQAAMVNAFTALATAAGDRVFSVIPKSATYPYVQVWPGYEVPVDEDCFDRTESTMQVDVWADHLSYIKVKEIAAALRDTLHENVQSLNVSGHVVDRVRIETVNFTDAPPLYRARLSIVVETQPV